MNHQLEDLQFLRNWPQGNCLWRRPWQTGSRTRMAPSRQSSGHLKWCSSVIFLITGQGFSLVTQPVSTAFMKMPCALKSAAEVRVSMLRAALAMLVCGWKGCLLARQKTPSIEETLSTHEGERPVSLPRSAPTRWNGTTAFTTCVVKQSTSGTSSTRCTQLLLVRLSRGCPNSSTSSRSISPATALQYRLGSASAALPALCSARQSTRRESSRASCSFLSSSAQNCCGRTRVCAALLTRMSSFSTACWRCVTRAATCACARKSHCMTKRRSFHSAQSASRRQRSSASLGKREVTNTRAPSRSSRSAISKPILILPPVTSAVSPAMLARWCRLAQLKAAHSGQSCPQKGWISEQRRQQMWHDAFTLPPSGSLPASSPSSSSPSSTSCWSSAESRAGALSELTEDQN